MQVTLYDEQGYLFERLGDIRTLLGENIDKAAEVGSDYAHYYISCFKKQENQLESLGDSIESDHPFESRRLIMNVRDTNFVFSRHLEYKDRMKEEIDRYRQRLHENISDDSIEPRKRVLNIIDWARDEFRYGFNESPCIQRVMMECLKDVVEPQDVVKETLEFVMKEKRSKLK